MRYILTLCVLLRAYEAACQAASQPAFDIASVKKSTPDAPALGRHIGEGKFEFRNVRMIDLIEYAYGVDRMHISGPAWIRSGSSFDSPDRYYVLATYPPGTPK